MNIQALLVVKDEVDVVGDVIRSAGHWATRINVLDNGSTDGTWELLRRCAMESPRVNLLGRSFDRFHDGLRAEAFQRCRGSAGKVDWWVRLDADEFYITDPRPILRTIPRWYDAVQGSMYQFYITDVDVEKIDDDLAAWESTPLMRRLRWYRNNWSELRCIRGGTTKNWVGTPWPRGSLRMSPASVPIRHYQYRFPAQISRRIQSRTELKEFVHERTRESGSVGDMQEFWRRVVEPHERLDYDDGHGPLIARHNPDPGPQLRMRRQAGWLVRKLLSPSGTYRLRRRRGR